MGSKHTEYYVGENDRGMGRKDYAVIDASNNVLATVNNRIYAQFIVKAVNNHDKLVEALERCRDILANMDDDNNYCSSNDYLNAVHFTNQALDNLEVNDDNR